MGNRLSKKNLTTPCALSSASKRLALFKMPSDVTSSPLAAAVRSSSSGAEPQNRYDKRVAISSPVGRRSEGCFASAAPNSGRYKKSGDCRTASIIAAMPELKVSPLVTLFSNASRASASPAASARRYALGTQLLMNVCAQLSCVAELVALAAQGASFASEVA